MCALFAAIFTACDKDAHENEYPLSDGQGALIIGLESGGATVDGLVLYLFAGNGTTALRKVYDDPRGLASEYILANAGSYTIMIVANANDATLPQETTVADLTEWLKAYANDYPGLLTASAQTEVDMGEIHRLTLELKEGASGISLTTVALKLTVPGLDLPAYTTRANGDSKLLRCVAEVYQAGTSNRVHRRVQDCSLQSDGTFLAELSLMPGDYDLRLWADWDGDAGRLRPAPVGGLGRRLLQHR